MTTRYGMGCNRDTSDPRDLLCCVDQPSDTPVPDRVDMTPGMPPVWHQGAQGCCSGHAVAGAVHYVDWENGCFPIGGPRPSPRFAYWNARSAGGTADQDSGASIRDIVKSVNTFGICSEIFCEYDPANWTERPDDDAYTAAYLHRSIKYERVPQTLASLKSVLAQWTPIVFGIMVYESFQSAEVAASGIVPMPKGAFVGGHALLLSGYDANQRVFIVRNSWGLDWGLRGYCVIPFDFVTDPDLSFDFWAINSIA